MATLPAWSASGAEVLLPRTTPGGLERIDTGREPIRAKAAQPVALLAGTSIAVAEPGAEQLASAQPFPGEVILGLVASPSGERVAFKRMGEGVYVMNRDGSGLTFLGQGEEPAWSPDGEWVAVQRTSDDGYVFTGADLYLLRADGTETVRLTETPDVLEMRPAFAPSGDALVFDAGGVIYRAPIALR
jgi:hypothetical protein